jgi:tetratricopeptide (TPR) repeat protein
MLLSSLGLFLACGVCGCSAGKALFMSSPAKKHTPAEQLAHVASAYEARGDYKTAVETYRQALALDPGDRRLQQQLAKAQQMSRVPEVPTDPYESMRRESAIASSRRSEALRSPSSVRTVSAPSQSRLRQLVRNTAGPQVEEPADWAPAEDQLEGFTDEELMGMESALP